MILIYWKGVDKIRQQNVQVSKSLGSVAKYYSKADFSKLVEHMIVNIAKQDFDNYNHTHKGNRVTMYEVGVVSHTHPEVNKLYWQDEEITAMIPKPKETVKVDDLTLAERVAGLRWED